jgi:3',5'-nucleoside bisphosphate phosphatase
LSELRTELPDDALVDAHVHSIASDGALTLRQLANLARRSGLAAVVPCDHDVIHDPDELEEAGASAGVLFLPGVELTVTHGDRTLHLLAYGFHPHHAGLLEAVRRRQEQRRKRWAALSVAILKQKVRLDLRRLERIGAGKAPGRRHLARELVAAHHATSVKNAFERYLHGLVQGYVDDDPLHVADAISLVHSAGGKAVLAHPPANLTVGDWRFLVASGMDGIEADYPRVAKNHRRFLQERIAEYGFASTAGSDYHGDEPRDHLGLRTMKWKTFCKLTRDDAARASGEA